MPAGLQDWIHKLEEGEGAKYIKLFAVALGVLALTVIYQIREYKNFLTAEAMESAQLARNIAEGEGFTSHVIRPFAVYLLQKHRGEGESVLKEPLPDIQTPPLYPLLVAGLMKVAPFDFEIADPRVKFFRTYQPERIISFLNQGLFFLAAILLFFLGRRLFDPAVAWTTVLVFLGAELFWRFSVSGLSTMLLLVLFLGVVWCLVAMEQQHREGARGGRWFLGMALLTGILVGLGALTRYSFGWLMIPVLAYVVFFLGARRYALSLVLAAAFLAVMAPWLVRNYQVSGTFFGTAGYALYQETSPFPGNRLERSLITDFEDRISKVDLEEYFRKLFVNTAGIMRTELPTLGGSWMTAFFLVGLLVAFRNPSLNRLRLFLVFCLPVLVVVQALGRTHLSSDVPEVNSENLLVLLGPLVFLFGVGLFFLLLEQLELPFLPLRPAVIGLFVAVVCAPLIFTFLPPRSYPLAYPPYYPPRVQEIGQWMEKDELLMSDMPWAVAWYGNRNCLWATIDAPLSMVKQAANDFFLINDYQKEIKGIYLTTLTTDGRFYSEILTNPDFSWGRFMVESLVRTNVPTGFPLRRAPNGYLESGHLFLTDRERWSKNR